MPHVDSSAKVCLACLVKYFPTWRMSDLLGLSCSLINSSALEIDFQWWNQGVSRKGMLKKKITRALKEARENPYNSVKNTSSSLLSLLSFS